MQIALMAAAHPPTVQDRRSDTEWKIIPPPTRRQKVIMWVLVGFGLLSLGIFLWWFLDRDFIGYAPLYWVLAVAFGYKILRMLHEWYHYVGISAKPRPELTRDYRVDMLTTFCAGEPYDMVLETLEAMVNVRYPHTTYLCDEANDPFLQQKCAEMGVVHVYRGEDKTNAKAGNINYALTRYATGEIAIILDPDHKPVPEFIDRVLPYFEAEEVGYVQCVQAYKNRNESFIAKGAAQQTYHFYGPMMMSMNAYGTAQAIGANCAFRRAALDSIGGHAPGLSEDMHTAMRLHAQGWQSVYVPESLTRGLVPATLSGYYKQQLKWSRGTFDLLFRVLPKLAPRLTWRQLIHYLTIPLFFLSGLIALIDISVPILALVLAKSPWYVELGELVQYTLPLLTMIVLIRQYAQHWTLEEHEGGFHFLGGALLFGSWWVTLTGFVYAIFNVKVPYIPTPKGDELTNEWRISRPNLIAIALSLAAIGYGLSIDWSPYSFIMAGYAGINVFMLGFLVLISQQKLIGGLYRRLYADSQSLLRLARRQFYLLRHRLLYRAMRNRWVASFLIFAATLVSLSFIDQTPGADLGKGVHNTNKIQQRVLLGTSLPDHNPPSWLVARRDTGQALPIDLLTLPETTTSLRAEGPYLQQLLARGLRPVVNWIPGQADSALCQAVIAGQQDSLLRADAQALRELPGTIFLRLAPQAASAPHPWGRQRGNTAADFVAAWRHVVNLFRREGVPNVVWVWQPSPRDSARSYYPGARYVDYVDLPLFQGLGSGRAFPSLDSLYLPLRNQGYAHPVMLSDFRQPTVQRSAWLHSSFVAMRARYPEIQALLFQHPEVLLPSEAPSGQTQPQGATLYTYLRDLNQRSDSDWQPSGWLGAESGRALSPMAATDLAASPQADTWAPSYLTRQAEGQYQWLVAGEPFEPRGVVYNPSQDWRDGHTPLTRQKLKRDFTHIQAMGANVISRYRPGIYDENLLRAADDMDMKVLYGFWFDPWIDYHADTARVNRLIEEVVTRVREERHHRAIVGWGLGSETWQRLRYHFQPEYLLRVRVGYLRMLDEMSRRIHALDSGRVVYTTIRAGDELPAALYMLRRYAPTVDMPGIAALYEVYLRDLDSLMAVHWSHRPYFVAEFGVDGHWDDRYTELDEQGFLREPSDYAKAQQIQAKWQQYLAGSRSLGELAYCWQDRFDGTETWYGLSDAEGRVKPAYYALREAWTGTELTPPLADAYLQSPLAIPATRKFLNFRAISPNNLRDDLTYEWRLVKQHSNEPVGHIDVKSAYHLALVDLPLPPGGYRLYLRITDNEGNMVTASEGFPVWPTYNGE